MKNKSISLIIKIFFIILFALKINGNINLPWWIILSPVWISVIVIFLILFTIGAVMAQEEGVDHD